MKEQSGSLQETLQRVPWDGGQTGEVFFLKAGFTTAQRLRAGGSLWRRREEHAPSSSLPGTQAGSPHVRSAALC